jgi:transposase
VYVLDPSRSRKVPEKHLPKDRPVVLLVDRLSSYKAMEQTKLGLVLLAFCWAHVRRDFIRVAKGWTNLKPWALVWLRRIRQLYRLNDQRLQVSADPLAFAQADALLRQAVAEMHTQTATELADPHLHPACRKTLVSLQEHWQGLTRFVDDPRIPMDNNGSERRLRGPAVARKNFYGSAALWSGRLAAMLFSIFATLKLWKINPRRWLTWYFQSCAASGGQAPQNIESFLPWNLSQQQRQSLTDQAPENHDSS